MNVLFAWDYTHTTDFESGKESCQKATKVRKVTDVLVPGAASLVILPLIPETPAPQCVAKNGTVMAYSIGFELE